MGLELVPVSLSMAAEDDAVVVLVADVAEDESTDFDEPLLPLLLLLLLDIVQLTFKKLVIQFYI